MTELDVPSGAIAAAPDNGTFVHFAIFRDIIVTASGNVHFLYVFFGTQYILFAIAAGNLYASGIFCGIHCRYAAVGGVVNFRARLRCHIKFESLVVHTGFLRERRSGWSTALIRCHGNKRRFRRNRCRRNFRSRRRGSRWCRCRCKRRGCRPVRKWQE